MNQTIDLSMVSSGSSGGESEGNQNGTREEDELINLTSSSSSSELERSLMELVPRPPAALESSVEIIQPPVEKAEVEILAENPPAEVQLQEIKQELYRDLLGEKEYVETDEKEKVEEVMEVTPEVVVLEEEDSYKKIKDEVEVEETGVEVEEAGTEMIELADVQPRVTPRGGDHCAPAVGVEAGADRGPPGPPTPGPPHYHLRHSTPMIGPRLPWMPWGQEQNIRVQYVPLSSVHEHVLVPEGRCYFLVRPYIGHHIHLETEAGYVFCSMAGAISTRDISIYGGMEGLNMRVEHINHEQNPGTEQINHELNLGVGVINNEEYMEVVEREGEEREEGEE